MAQKINLFYLTIITWLVKQPTKAILHGGRNSQVVRYMRYWRHKRRLLWPIYHFRAISLQRNLLANIWATKMGIFRIFQCQRIIHRLSLNPYCLSQTSYLVKRFCTVKMHRWVIGMVRLPFRQARVIMFESMSP